MRLSRPILATASAALGSLGLAMVCLRWRWEALFSTPVLAALLLGLVYTQLIEYWYHRAAMHRGLPFLEGIKRNHLDHHRLFHGERFRTRDPVALQHIVGKWYAFPAMFFVHLAALRPLVDPSILLAFFVGTTLHYVAFEVTHWFTHVEDNAFDRLLCQVPTLGRIRAYQILHHRIHHEAPAAAFNFNPPYLGDLLTGRLPKPIVPQPVLDPVPQPVWIAAHPVVAAGHLASEITTERWRRRTLKYGAFAALAVALAGAAFLAHGRLARPKVMSNGRMT